jgi:hypothetical protein
MKQQDELGTRIAGVLAEGTESLSSEQRERLAAARRLALTRHAMAVETVRAPVLAPSGAFAQWTEQSVFGVSYFMPFAVLVLGLLGVVYMHTGTVAPEIAEIDAGLLTDELPIDAFLDQSLDSWLKRSPR